MKILAEPIAAPDPKGLAALGPGELGVRHDDFKKMFWNDCNKKGGKEWLPQIIFIKRH